MVMHLCLVCDARFSLCIYIYLYALKPLASPSHPFLSSSTTMTVTTINRWRWQTTGGSTTQRSMWYAMMSDRWWKGLENEIGMLHFIFLPFFNWPFICSSYEDKKWKTSLRRRPQSMGTGRYEQQWWWRSTADDEWWCPKGLEKWDVGMLISGEFFFALFMYTLVMFFMDVDNVYAVLALSHTKSRLPHHLDTIFKKVFKSPGAVSGFNTCWASDTDIDTNNKHHWSHWHTPIHSDHSCSLLGCSPKRTSNHWRQCECSASTITS